jgi:hypothetical protein
MMMRRQRAVVRECRINGRKDQETGNACASNRTSMKAWSTSAIKENIRFVRYFDFFNANLVAQNTFEDLT